MIRTPPDFCASATEAASASEKAHVAANLPRFRLIAHTSPGGRTLLVVWLVLWSSRERVPTAAGYIAADPGAIPAVGSEMRFVDTGAAPKSLLEATRRARNAFEWLVRWRRRCHHGAD